jgi:hypothetical protein
MESRRVTHKMSLIKCPERRGRHRPARDSFEILAGLDDSMIVHDGNRVQPTVEHEGAGEYVQKARQIFVSALGWGLLKWKRRTRAYEMHIRRSTTIDQRSGVYAEKALGTSNDEQT